MVVGGALLGRIRSCHSKVHSPLSALGRARVVPVLGCRLSWMLPCRPVAHGTSNRSTNCCCRACHVCLCWATSPQAVPATASIALSTSPAGLKRPACRTRTLDGFCCSARQKRRSFHWIMSVTDMPPERPNALQDECRPPLHPFPVHAGSCHAQ